MISIIAMYIIALIVGAIGGIVHQLHDSEQENTGSAYLRAIVMGAIAAMLMIAIYPVQYMNVLIVLSFTYGWFGDSIILNIVRRYGNKASS